MTILTSYDWESDTWTHHTGENPARTAFRQAVETIADKARTAVSELNGRVERAVQIILNGDLSIAPDGQGTIASQSNVHGVYAVGKGDTCSCKDHPKAPKFLCKHLLADSIYRKSVALAKQKLEAQAESLRPEPVSPESSVETHAAINIPAQFIVELHGKQFVTFSGLLTLAHERGLVSLKADFITVTAEIALAHAIATFDTGGEFLMALTEWNIDNMRLNS